MGNAVGNKRGRTNKWSVPRPLDEIDKLMITMIMQQPRITDQALADKLGLKERTNIWRRRQNPNWIALFDEVALPPKDVLRKEGSKIVRKLIAMMDNPAASAAVQVQAARALVAYVVPRKLEIEGRLGIKSVTDLVRELDQEGALGDKPPDAKA